MRRVHPIASVKTLQVELEKLCYELPTGHLKRHAAKALRESGRILLWLTKAQYPDQEASE